MIFDFLTPTTAGLIMLAGAVPPLGIVYWVRNDRHKPAVRWFQYAMLSGMAWSTLFGLLALVELPAFRFVVTNLLLIAIPSSAIFYFLFCYEFTFKKTPPNAVFLLFVPVILISVSAWFNPYNLIYTMTDPHLTEEILIPANAGSVRPIINVGMSYLLVVMSAGMVLGELMSAPRNGRKIQSLVILVTIVTIAVLGAVKVVDILPPYFDPTPIGWTLSGLLFAVSIKRYQFLQVSAVPWDQITNEMQDLLIVLDSENVVADANDTARELLDISVGMTTEELRTRHPELTAVLDGGTTATVELNVDGSRRVFETQSSPLADGGSAGQFVFGRDSTDRKAAEQAVEETEARYRRILQHSLDYAIIIDESGTVTDVTPGVEHVLGYEPDEMIGTDVFSYVHPDDRDGVVDAVTELLANPATQIDIEHRARTADGSYRWIEARGGNYLDDPVLDGAIANVRDVSARKEREQKQSRTTARLQRKNEQLERLAQVVSHDLQTPLSTAEKLTGLLRVDLDGVDADVEQSLADLETTHQRLREFADNLPRLARESTDVEGPTTCELRTVAKKAWRIAETGDLSLQIDSNRSLHGDPERLQRAFENLFENALTHGVDAVGLDDESGGNPQQSADSGDRESPTATTVRVGSFSGGFYVADDGPGIRPTQRDELFEYGMGTGSGSGFGLAIVRTTVEAHGWAVDVTDSTTGGARFEIYVDD